MESRPQNRSRMWVGVVVFVCWLVMGASQTFALPSKLGDLDSDGVLTVLDLTRLNAHIQGTAPLGSALAVYADITQDGFVNDGDVQALVRGILAVEDTAALPLAGVRETSPLAGEGGVAVTREAIVRFTTPLSPGAVLTTFDQNTQTPGHLYAEAGGRKLLTRVELSGDRLKATLFFLEPVPASSRVTVTFDGTGVLDLLGRPIDPDGDAQPGGELTFAFDTVPISPVPGTGVVGQIFASQVVAGQAQDTPLAGVTITVDGAEETLRTVTGAGGRFSLNPCPAGRFFVFIDGRTATNNVPAGAYYAFVGKAWEALPGKADNLAADTGTIYLPLIAADTLKPVSASEDTKITFPPSVLAQNPALAGVEIEVPANSLFADNGARGGKVGIAPVSPDRLPEPLPPGLAFPLVITIQTDGASNFDRPVPVKFPNLVDPILKRKLAPGEKSALWSFNHDLGTWEIQGPMTVSEDGKLIVTDVGVGVRQPGWHAAQLGSRGSGGGGFGGGDPGCGPDLAKAVLNTGTTALDLFVDFSGVEGKLACITNTAIAIDDFLYSYLLKPDGETGAEIINRSFSILLDCSLEFAGAGLLKKIGQTTKYANMAKGLYNSWVEYYECENPPQAARFRALALSSRGSDPILLQAKIFSDLEDFYAALFGSPRFTNLNPLEADYFGNVLLKVSIATQRSSDAGVRISDKEQLEIVSLPRPDSLSKNEIEALVLRFAMLAAGTLPPASLDSLAASATALHNDVDEARRKGWNSILDGLAIAGTNLGSEQAGKIPTNASISENVYYEILNTSTGVVQKGSLSTGVFSNFVLVPDSIYIFSYYDPLNHLIGHTITRSGPMGGSTAIPRAKLSPDVGSDSDNDGLSDAAEKIVGTDPNGTKLRAI